jgi:Domain of unknown function (DUF4440)
MEGIPSHRPAYIARLLRVLAGGALALLVAGAAVAASHASPPHGSAADQIRQIERTRLRALVDADTQTARPLIAPDFQLINPGGGALSRDDYLDSIASGDIDYLAFAPTSPIVVRQSGNAAALRFQVHFDLVVGGTRFTHEGWITELYEHRSGRWQIVWEQATAVPNRFDEFVSSLEPPEPTS